MFYNNNTIIIIIILYCYKLNIFGFWMLGQKKQFEVVWFGAGETELVMSKTGKAIIQPIIRGVRVGDTSVLTVFP